MPEQNEYDDWEGICQNHGLEDAVTLGAKDCPECNKQETIADFNRCAACALSKNKCSLCDGPIK